MPTELAPGILSWSRAELDLPPSGSSIINTFAMHEHFIHYTTGNELGVDDMAQWWRNIRNHHMRVNGWTDIAYNHGVARDPDPERAHIFEGRGWNRVGGHTLGHNQTGTATVFLGDDDPDYADATPGVRRAFALIIWLRAMDLARQGVQLQLKTHRDVNSTSCPGDELAAWERDGCPTDPYPGQGGYVPLPAPPPPPPLEAFEPRLVRAQPTLRRGQSGQQVGHLQRALNVCNGNLTVDGVFGRRTRNAVVAFQQYLGLAADGIYGPITARTLDYVLTSKGV